MGRFTLFAALGAALVGTSSGEGLLVGFDVCARMSPAGGRLTGKLTVEGSRFAVRMYVQQKSYFLSC